MYYNYLFNEIFQIIFISEINSTYCSQCNYLFILCVKKFIRILFRSKSIIQNVLSSNKKLETPRNQSKNDSDTSIPFLDLFICEVKIKNKIDPFSPIDSPLRGIYKFNRNKKYRKCYQYRL